MKFSKRVIALLISAIFIINGGVIGAFAEEDNNSPSDPNASVSEQEETPEKQSTTAKTTTKPSTTKATTTKKQTEKEKKEAKKKLENQRKELQKKKEEADKKLAKYGKNAKATEEYILALDEKIGYINDEIAVLRAQMDASQQEIDKLNVEMQPLKDELDKLQKEYDTYKAEYEKLDAEFQDVYGAYCLRLRAMYVSGNSSVIAALLSSDGIEDFISRFEMVRAVTRKDSKLLKKVRKEMNEIADKQSGLDKKKKDIEKKKKVYDDKVAKFKAEQDTVIEKREDIAKSRLQLDEDRLKSDELYAEYAATHKIYSDFADEDVHALDSIDKEIDDLLSGKKSAGDVTTAKNPKLKSKKDVKIKSVGKGDIYSNSDATLSFRWPVPGHTRLSQHFGHIRAGRVHKGIDIPCPTGSKIVAAQKGVVIRARSNASEAYGYHIMIYHGTDKRGRRIVTCYAHNSKLLVQVGDHVAQGQQIAKSGSTGRSTGPHSHFEVIIDGTKVNPENYV